MTIKNCGCNHHTTELIHTNGKIKIMSDFQQCTDCGVLINLTFKNEECYYDKDHVARFGFCPVCKEPTAKMSACNRYECSICGKIFIDDIKKMEDECQRIKEIKKEVDSIVKKYGYVSSPKLKQKFFEYVF